VGGSPALVYCLGPNRLGLGRFVTSCGTGGSPVVGVGGSPALIWSRFLLQRQMFRRSVYKISFTIPIKLRYIYVTNFTCIERKCIETQVRTALRFVRAAHVLMKESERRTGLGHVPWRDSICFIAV
jgi:hypothetical protein